jgi:phosphoribosylformimino-5-aminoimidazole carboxamide ribotide isomerase
MERAARNFIVFPAIDLRQGQVVRLAQGDLRRVTLYDTQPIAAAERWRAAGADWLHVVNLDGAFGENSPANAAALPELIKSGLNIQFGGGVRDIETVKSILQAGVARVVIGTAAVETPVLIDRALAEFGPERIVVGVDARDGRVRLRGWADAAAVDALTLAQRLKGQGIATIIFTDVARDGLGTGINLEATRDLALGSELRVVASGGVHGLGDVQSAIDVGLAGIIIGRALYEGQIDLVDALSLIRPGGARSA